MIKHNIRNEINWFISVMAVHVVVFVSVCACGICGLVRDTWSQNSLITNTSQNDGSKNLRLSWCKSRCHFICKIRVSMIHWAKKYAQCDVSLFWHWSITTPKSLARAHGQRATERNLLLAHIVSKDSSSRSVRVVKETTEEKPLIF